MSAVGGPPFLTYVWRDGTPCSRWMERLAMCNATMCMQTRTLPLQSARKKCDSAIVSSRVSTVLFGMCMFLCLVCFVSLFDVTWKY